jgi:hypothetical protein
MNSPHKIIKAITTSNKGLKDSWDALKGNKQNKEGYNLQHYLYCT